MKKTAIILLGLCAGLSSLHAQQSYTYEVQKYATQESSYDDCRTDRHTDIENTMSYQLRHHTALYDWRVKGLSAPFSSLRRDERGVVTVSMNQLNRSGEHLFYEGADRISGEVVAGSHFTLKNMGTLFGKASYRQRLIEDMRFNYATHPEDYVPYLVGDSLTRGDTHQEIYTIEGGYSKQFKKFHFGVDALYEGIAEHRTTNPKYSNYSYWLRFGLNAAWNSGPHLVSLRVYPEHNSQSVSASTFVQSTKYFLLYGFGQWNHRETVGGLSYGRVQRIWGGGGDLLYVYGGDWKCSAQLVYNYRRMTTEEYSFKNLFASNRHYLREQISLSKDLGRHTLYLQASAMQQKADGKENVYENQKVSDDQNLFDYILVGHNSFYNRKHYGADFRGKMVFNLPERHALHVLAGVGYVADEETYDMPHIRIESASLLPMAGIGYQRHHSRYAVECNVTAAMQRNLSGTYDYATSKNDIFTRAQAYVPYLLKTEDNTQISADFLFSHVLAKKFGLGFRGTFAYLNSDHRRQFAYNLGMNFMF